VSKINKKAVVKEQRIEIIKDDFDDISREEFPSCCGIDVIVGFPETHDEVVDMDYSTWPYKPLSDPYIRRYVVSPKAIKRSVTYAEKHRGFSDSGMLLISLIEKQREIAEPVLLDLGYTLLTDFHNPNTTNHVWLYHKKLKQPKGKKVTKRAFG
jgi:hypothetical protein